MSVADNNQAGSFKVKAARGYRPTVADKRYSELLTVLAATSEEAGELCAEVDRVVKERVSRGYARGYQECYDYLGSIEAANKTNADVSAELSRASVALERLARSLEGERPCSAPESQGRRE